MSLRRAARPVRLAQTKPKVKPPKCSHCWHVFSSTTDGMGVRGFDQEQCCHCGTKREHYWRWERDLAHGPHVPLTRRVYEKEP